MAEVILWWLTIQALAFVSLVPALLLFRSLPDRGYGLAKSLGLLLPGYGLWLLAWSGFLPNGRGALAFVLVLVASGSVFLVRDRNNRDSIRAFFRNNRRLVFHTEAVFAASFFAFALLRAYHPDIAGTEQPMDFAFLNAIIRSDYFPPNDPWLSGYAISYYYFGYLIQTIPITLTSIPSNIGFNLALSSTFALTVTGAFSLGFNLVALRSPRAAPAVGVLAGALVAVIGNLQGALEMARARGLGAPALWQWIGVNGALTPYVSSSWLPTEHFWWWHATRVINTLRYTLGPEGNVIAVNDQLDYTITEFPFFSFILGDMHPHVMALPFTLLALGLALSILRRQPALGLGWVQKEPFAFLGASLVLGSLGFINSWDMPTYLAIAFGALLLAAIRWGQVRWSLLGLMALLGLTSLLLFFPFYLSPRPPTPAPALIGTVGTNPIHFFIIWGAFLFIMGCYILGRLLSGRASISLLAPEPVGTGLKPAPTPPGPIAISSLRHSRSVALYSAAAALALPAFWALGQAVVPRVLGQPPLVGAAAAYKELSVLPLVVVVGVVLFMLARELGLGATEESFVLLLILVGFTLTLGTELFFLKDSFGTRMNTVFKFYYQAWLLFAIASAYGLYWVAAKLKATHGWLWLKGLWWGGVAVFLAAALAYPVAASFSRMDMFQRRPSLDGLAFVKGFDPAEYEAIEWLKGNIEGSPTIVEAPGGAYTDFGRVSSRTGLPTVIQWPGHEAQWRGPLKELGEREQDVNQIYSSPDAALVQRLLGKYGISYVYAGRLERARYGEASLGRFASTMDTVFQNQGVSIYRVRR